MTSDQLDAYAERLAFQAVEIAGADDAPGALLQAMTLIMLEHHSIDAMLFCLDRTVADLRADVAAGLKLKGTIQ